MDAVFAEICKAVYGPEIDPREVWDIAKMNDASEVHVNGASTQVGVGPRQNKQPRVRLRPAATVPPVRSKVIKAKKDDDGKKALVGGLLFGSAAEGAATAAAASKLTGGGHIGVHRPAPSPLRSALHVAHESKTGKAAELGLQAVNLGVGLAAAKELAKPKKPKLTPVSKARVPHFQPATLVAANARARRNGVRLGYATAATGGAAAGYTAGRRKLKKVTVEPIAKAGTRENVHRAALGANGVAGVAGASFGAAKLRDTYTEQYPKASRSHLRAAATGARKAGVSNSSVRAGLKLARTGKPGFKTLAVASTAGAAGAGLHALGQHLDHKKTQAKLSKAACEWTGVISKVDTHKRQVFGWASLSIVDGQPVIDLQDDYVSIEEIEKAAYTYVLDSRKGGDMHERIGKFATAPKHTADLIESVVITPEKLEAWNLAPDALPLGWWTGYHVNDDQQWQDVLDGKRLGFSIHGMGTRREMVAA